MAGRIKRFLPRSLFGRALLIIVVPLVIVQVVSTYIFFGNHWGTVTRRLAENLAGDVAVVVELLQRFPAPENEVWIFQTAERTMHLRVSFEPGAIMGSAAAYETPTFFGAALNDSLRDRVRRPFHIDADSYENDVEISVQLGDGVLRVVASRKRLFSSTTYVFVLWMVGTSMLLFGVASIFMRNQVRSVRRLAAAADSFGKGRDVPDFKPEGALEVRQAAAAFNLMRDRIRQQIAQRTEMLAGVSHDLRTPLTRMKLQLAMLGDGDGVGELKADVADMEHMIEGYLAFARGEGSEAIRPADLTALLEDVVGRARREGAAVDLHCEGDLALPLRPHATGRALTNLVGNAARYGTHVWVRAGRRGDAIEVLVDDDGPGIPLGRREDVFKAFVRLEGSRNPATGGVGLGLTIARDVVRGHGGELLLEDSPMGGLRARVRLPL